MVIEALRSIELPPVEALTDADKKAAAWVAADKGSFEFQRFGSRGQLQAEQLAQKTIEGLPKTPHLESEKPHLYFVRPEGQEYLLGEALLKALGSYLYLYPSSKHSKAKFGETSRYELLSESRIEVIHHALRTLIAVIESAPPSLRARLMSIFMAKRAEFEVLKEFLSSQTRFAIETFAPRDRALFYGDFEFLKVNLSEAKRNFYNAKEEAMNQALLQIPHLIERLERYCEAQGAESLTLPVVVSPYDAIPKAEMDLLRRATTKRSRCGPDTQLQRYEVQSGKVALARGGFKVTGCRARQPDRWDAPGWRELERFLERVEFDYTEVGDEGPHYVEDTKSDILSKGILGTMSGLYDVLCSLEYKLDYKKESLSPSDIGELLDILDLIKKFKECLKDDQMPRLREILMPDGIVGTSLLDKISELLKKIEKHIPKDSRHRTGENPSAAMRSRIAGLLPEILE